MTYLKYLFSFKGRINTVHYIIGIIAFWICNYAIEHLLSFLNTSQENLSIGQLSFDLAALFIFTAILIAMAWCILAFSVRRLRDAGINPWWILLTPVIIVFGALFRSAIGALSVVGFMFVLIYSSRGGVTIKKMLILPAAFLIMMLLSPWLAVGICLSLLPSETDSQQKQPIQTKEEQIQTLDTVKEKRIDFKL